MIGAADVSVHDLSHDSRQVGPGWAFACVRGDHFDGHDFAATAVERGVEVLIVDRPLPLDAAQIVVTDVRQAMGSLAAAVHGHPATKMRMVGITGTNGKTTTTHLLAAALRGAGYEVRQVGTLTGARTTPEAPDLQRLLAGFVADGVDAVVMEVSSHALALHRVGGTRFDAAVFTNLGRDHLDLHESMEAYFRAKASLFVPELTAVGITNLDDRHGRLLLDAATVEMVGFELADASDIEVGVEQHSVHVARTPGQRAARRAIQRDEHVGGADDYRPTRDRHRPGDRRLGRLPAGGGTLRSGQRSRTNTTSRSSSTTPTRPMGSKNCSPLLDISPACGRSDRRVRLRRGS